MDFFHYHILGQILTLISTFDEKNIFLVKFHDFFNHFSPKSVV
jgi:hypothetical protein